MGGVTYKLKIRGLKSPDGTIPIKAMKELLDNLLECSERGLRLAVQGESVKTGKVPSWLTRSLDLTITGLEKGSTVLDLEAPVLADTAAEQIRDQDLWYTKPTENDTALTLLYKSVRDTTFENLESDTYDAGVLNGLLSFESFLKNSAESIELESNDRPQERFVLGCPEIEKIRQLRTYTPEPMAVLISGQFDMIQHSKKRFHLRLSDGQVLLGTVDPEFVDVETMRKWWGKKVTIKGIVHFRAKGKVRLIEAQMIKPMEQGEEVFERVPQPLTQQELFEATVRKSGTKSPLMEVWDKWPGNESIEELLAALNG